MPFQNDIQNNSSEINSLVHKMSHVQKEWYAYDRVYTIRRNFLYDSTLLDLAFFPVYSKPAHR